MLRIRQPLTVLVSISVFIGQAVAAPAEVASAQGTVVLRDGVEIKLRFVEALSSKTAHVGDQITLELAQDVRASDVLLIRQGATALGEVTTAKKSGMLGKGGDLAIQLQYLKAGDVKVKLRGTKGDEGDSKVGTTIVLMAAFGVFGMLKHGKNAEVPAGTMITAYVSQDTSLPPLEGRPVVGVAAAPATAANSSANSPVPVKVTSDPSSAELEIDGAFVGNTPATIQLAPGEHKVKITSGSRVWERTLTVHPGSDLNVNATLEPAGNRPPQPTENR